MEFGFSSLLLRIFRIVGSSWLEFFGREDEVAAQVFLAHHGVGGEFLARALEEHSAFEEHVGAVGDAEDRVGLVVGDEHPDIALLEVVDDLLNVFDGDGVDGGERLVEHDELGADGQATGYLGASPLTAAETVAVVLAHLLQSELADKALELLFLLFAAEVGHLQHGADVILHRQLAEDARLLCQVADSELGALVDGHPGDVLAVEEDASAIGGDEADSHVESGGLAGAVWSEQTYYLSLADIDADVVGDSALAVALDQVVGDELARFGRYLRVETVGGIGTCEGKLRVESRELSVVGSGRTGVRPYRRGGLGGLFLLEQAHCWVAGSGQGCAAEGSRLRM